MMARYYGERIWCYRFTKRKPDSAKLSAGKVDLGTNAGFGYKNDERFARYLIRKKLGIKRLPPGTQVTPMHYVK